MFQLSMLRSLENATPIAAALNFLYHLPEQSIRGYHKHSKPRENEIKFQISPICKT